MKSIRTFSTTAVSLSLLLMLSACASLPEGKQLDPQDPFERYNRAVYSFNDTVDRAVLKPVATAYKNVLPGFAQTGIHNVFANISDLPTAVNQLLQGKPKLALTQMARVTLNTTFGVLGLFDVASGVGLERTREDFGQTLGRWGVASGPYVVLPLLGSSTVRDALALPVDYQLDPLMHMEDKDWRFGLSALRVIDLRANLLNAEKTVESMELDAYLFRRDAYLSQRRSGVYDGNPPDVEPKTDKAPPANEPKPLK